MGTDSTVELVKALAWPLIALFIAVAFRRTISVFLGALGGRITKLSVFKVELELTPATAASSTPLLDDIRTATNSAVINDSSRMMLEQVQSAGAADFAVVELGTGREWITSRLFIAATMMERMRGVQVCVFVERTQLSERRFVAVASVQQMRWALARRYPWLEAAWACAYVSLFPGPTPPPAEALPRGAKWLPEPTHMNVQQPIITSDSGGLGPSQARWLVSHFIDSLQLLESPGPNKTEWTKLGEKTWERGTYVTRELLESLLPQHVFANWSNALRDSSRAQRTRAVLRRAGDFVALVEDEREFLRLANRRVLLEDIAASLGEEPESPNG